jgi:hypothetical protein
VLRLSLKDNKVGVLRKTDSHPVPVGAKIELIAISSGSATRKDLDAAYEEKEDRKAYNRRVSDRRRRLACRWEPAEVNDVRTSFVKVDNTPQSPHERYYDRARSHSKDDIIYFYNVLWIERKGDLAFRKAAGRVLKSAWDEHCSGPVDIVLA